ncbi:hypothetical protein HanXRQr2_Chr17g0791941 [Helianthus annuus]|uniref:Uncharacterized protein n=1 Tax=Helianthus annuus TaxID=4232 RepID=A0A9K3GTB5_HELAN|nr:hypothetical protein HanXRQr2_Chr17g0791941 [Helianthus annuus]KAJ0432458.1 hypothetical protein HanIR_Chr17g0859461 [Helianthus annuus]KAJ0812245.1 hypothetical protein HanPSC8_Chr17g0759871 [Helianthus annuus]
MKVEKSVGINILGDLEDDKEGFSDRKARICIDAVFVLMAYDTRRSLQLNR